MIQSASRPSPSYGPPGATPGIPTDAELEASGAVIGNIVIDNENIFNLDNPQENNKLFALADHLHGKTRPAVICKQRTTKACTKANRPRARRLTS
jgi:hypothetical protein